MSALEDAKRKTKQRIRNALTALRDMRRASPTKTVTVNIPFDDSIPQSSEGEVLFSMRIFPGDAMKIKEAKVIVKDAK